MCHDSIPCPVSTQSSLPPCHFSNIMGESLALPHLSLLSTPNYPFWFFLGLLFILSVLFSLFDLKKKIKVDSNLLLLMIDHILFVLRFVRTKLVTVDPPSRDKSPSASPSYLFGSKVCFLSYLCLIGSHKCQKS